MTAIEILRDSRKILSESESKSVQESNYELLQQTRSTLIFISGILLSYGVGGMLHDDRRMMAKTSGIDA